MSTPQPTTLEDLVRNEVFALTPVLGMLARGPESYFPFAGRSPGETTPTPYIVTTFGGESGSFVYDTDFTFWVYDDPAKRYWRIRDIVKALRDHFNYLWLPPSKTGYTQYFQVLHAHTAPPQTDDMWLKNYIWTRFSTFGG
jgi:hypothetical protein